MDNRAEWFFENTPSGMTMEDISEELGVPSTETPSVFDLQGFYNEAQRRANMGVPLNNDSIEFPKSTEIFGCL